LPLHAIGLDQADATSTALKEVKFAAVYSSPLQRAVQTAKIIAPSLTPRIVPDLTECDVGAWEGLTWDAIKERWPAEHSLHMADSVTHGYLGGESFADVLTRSQPVIRGIGERHDGQTVLVVSHHVVIRSLLASMQGLPTYQYRQVSVANCGINVIEVEKGRPRVVQMNETQHLTNAAA
jgi:broad specificity phosphatase PhoE